MAGGELQTIVSIVLYQQVLFYTRAAFSKLQVCHECEDLDRSRDGVPLNKQAHHPVSDGLLGVVWTLITGHLVAEGDRATPGHHTSHFQ